MSCLLLYVFDMFYILLFGDSLRDLWNVCRYVCMYVHMYVCMCLTTVPLSRHTAFHIYKFSICSDLCLWPCPHQYIITDFLR